MKDYTIFPFFLFVIFIGVLKKTFIPCVGEVVTKLTTSVIYNSTYLQKLIELEI